LRNTSHEPRVALIRTPEEKAMIRTAIAILSAAALASLVFTMKTIELLVNAVGEGRMDPGTASAILMGSSVLTVVVSVCATVAIIKMVPGLRAPTPATPEYGSPEPE
jgi:hypothetical protein